MIERPGRPGIFLREIKDKIYLKLGVTITESALCVFLHREGFTRQKLKLYAVQRSEELRTKFSSDMALFNAEMLLFLDESGTDCRDSLRKKGYSLRGKPAKKQRLFCRGEHVSVLCVMSLEGILSCYQSCKFTDFIENSVMPNIMPFDGINPRSVLIMDNCAIHHIPDVTALIQRTGTLILVSPILSRPEPH